jgi:hypothetical protein
MLSIYQPKHIMLKLQVHIKDVLNNHILTRYGWVEKHLFNTSLICTCNFNKICLG